MQSIGRSMDWTLEDNMADGLLFCATLTGRSGGHTHLYKQERKSPTPVRRQFSRTQALHGKVIPGGCRCRGWKCGVLWGCPPTSAARTLLLLSDKLMTCCAAGTNGCLDLRRRASALNGRVGAESSRCPGSVAWYARDSVAPLRRSSAGWMPARIGKLFAGVGRVVDASLTAGSMRRCEHWGTGQERSILQLNAPGPSWLFATLWLQRHSRSQQAASPARRQMWASC